MGRATLVIMAAGLGSRFGEGIKQLEPVGPGGEIIMDYSIYDALEAGFDKVVFVIRRDLEKAFREVVGKRIEKITEVAYAYQEVEDIPSEFRKKFSDRTKPWGTGQAVLCCKNVVDGPFLVINADDYYGKEAYREAYSYLTSMPKTGKIQICMVGFVLKNTLSENGGVTRGICRVDDTGMLTQIVETHNIEKCGENAVVRDGENMTFLDIDSPVSMNMWGLPASFFDILEEGFRNFLNDTPQQDLKAEYLLPTLIGQLLREKRIGVKVLKSQEQWFGVTYKEDKDAVVNALKKLTEEESYPSVLYTLDR